MNPQFKIRNVGRNGSGLSETLDFEISISNPSRKRVFIVLDLSDSCILVFEHLRKLQPLWRELPSNWLVSFLALGGGEVLPDEGASYSAGDLENIVCELENSPERQKWERAGQSRGSTIHFSLKVIENISRTESQLGEGQEEEKLVFVLTDGELLDADPIILPLHISVIGVRIPTTSGRQPRWDKVLPGSKIFLQNSSELFEETRQLVSPEKQLCEIKAKFPFSLASDFSAGSLQKQNNAGLNWDFRKGPLVITIPNSVVNDSNAYIECLLKNGESVQLPILIEKVITAPNQKRSSIAGGEFFAIHDENLVVALQKHFQEKAVLKQKWGTEFVRMILNANGGQLASTAGKTVFDAFFAVFVKRASSKSVPQNINTIVIGKLRKGGPSLVFSNELMKVPLDPGFASLKKFEIKYNLLEARWCIIKNGDTNYLDPNGSVRLTDEFIDVQGRACVAFYSGPLDSTFCE